MKRIQQLLFASLVIIFVTSCRSGYNTYKQGDYYRASMEAIERLRSKPGNKKSQYVLTNAYPMALKSAQREIDNANLANGTDRFDIIVFQYERINQLANAIFHCPKAYQLIPQPKEFVAELSDARQQAAEQAYNIGLAAIEANTIEQARLGYQYFTKAHGYVYGYKNVLLKIEEARYYATLRVVVQRPFTSTRYQYSADFFYNNLMSEMSQSAKNRFVRFYTPEEAQAENMRDPHHYIALNFEDFSIGNIRETSNTADVKRDSVIVGTVQVEGKTYNTYNTVKAKFTTYRQEISSGGVMSLRVIDALGNRDLQHRNFNGQYVWTTNWATFQGDDRALTPEQKKLCGQKPHLPPPHQDLFVEFTKPIFSQAVTAVRNIYSKY